MAEDFYTDDYYGGDFYDGGYGYTGDVSYLANGSGGGFDYGYYDYYDPYYYEPYYYEPIDYAPDFEPLPMPEYEPLPYVEPIVFEPSPEDFFGLPDLPTYQQEEFFPVLPFTPLPDYVLEPLPPIELFPEVIQMETETALAPIEQPVTLPTLAPLPFVPTSIDFEPLDFFGLPYVSDPLPVPLPPPTEPGKLGPCNTPNGLPGVCPQGQYHPQSNPCECVPFPPAPAPAPKPTTQQTSTTAPKPPSPTPSPTSSLTQQQQACPTGYCKHPQTGQCMQIPYGYARHPQTQVCVLASQQQQTSPVPTEVETAFSDLKNLPWWVWAAGVGLVLLSGRGR